ncbi:MAG TPA: acyl-CoA dehydrogenase family protein, partial [Caulobacteraceae bacterium]
HMFIMMNAARLAVGVEGVAIAERAYQGAVAYARERRQGRSAWTGEASAPILDHPDVRRMLAVSKAKIEAARAICLHTAVAAGLAEHGKDEAERKKWKAREDLLVPISKAWSTDIGCEVASIGVQVCGGMGFIEETGAAQHYRDARIAPIYEGTNGIQAMDLVGRKLSLDGGQAVRELTAEMRELSEKDQALRWLEPASIAIDTATDWVLARKGQPERAADVLVAADGYLKLLGEGFGGLMLARGVLAAKAKGEGYEARAGMFEIYAVNVLSAGPGRMVTITQGDRWLKAAAL